MTQDLVNQVVGAGPVSVAVVLAAVALILAGTAMTVARRPWTSAGVLAAGVAVLGALAVSG